ncbi:hypothetical protein [Myxococcus stipitatus]|uniref:hypothetical protein n=1 Tax=Myxococcus stipitatus TaxID=83455 RepID=UPI0030D15977
MKTNGWTTRVVLLGLVGWSFVGCGEDSLRPVPGGDEPVNPAPRPTPPGTTRYELRIRGVKSQGYTSALLGVESLSATVKGQPVQVQLRARTIDLANTEHAHLVGYFFMPEGSSDVKLSMRFGAFGGFEHEGGAGMIDARTGPLTFDTNVENLRRNGRATVLLDLSRSLTQDRHGRLFLPRTRLVH